MSVFIKAFLSLGVLLISIIGLFAWLDSPLDNILYEDIEKDIKKISVEFDKDKIYLNIYVSKPMSCNEVTTKLQIETLPIREKNYSPSCSIVNKRLIRIVYSEKINI